MNDRPGGNRHNDRSDNRTHNQGNFGNGPSRSGPRGNRFGGRGPQRGPGGGPGGGPGRGPGRGPRFEDRRGGRNDDQRRPDPIEILHLEEHIVVVKKPVGVVTAAVRSRNATALDMTREELKRRRERNLRVFPVHEIDRDASGVLVFARTDEATNELRRQFRSRGSDRIYLALIEATIAPDTPPTTIRSRIIENSRGVGESVDDHEAAPAGPNRPHAAVTHVRPVASRDGLTLVRLRAETDHPYQLRAHMSESGTPVAGDRAYRTRRDDIPRLALHLGEVTFSHPITGEKTRFASPAPAPFYELVGKAPPSGAAVSKTYDAEGKAEPTHWDPVSAWYDEMIGGKGNDLYNEVLIPRTLDLIGDADGRTVLDIACGQGVLSRALAKRGATVVGVDAAAGLIERARELGDAEGKITYHEGDAQALTNATGETTFNAAVCLMALMNIADIDAVCRGAAASLDEGGSLVGVILHPAFRTPRQTSWGWVGANPQNQRQFRRIDAYMSETSAEITMNPGSASSGAEAVTTTTFHRSISEYVRALADAGFVLESLEEWTSPRESEPGPRADEENRARTEIPMFLAFRARLAPRGDAGQ